MLQPGKREEPAIDAGPLPVSHSEHALLEDLLMVARVVGSSAATMQHPKKALAGVLFEPKHIVVQR